MKPWTLYFDGACEPINPGGNCTYGWLLYSPDNALVASGNGFLGCGEGFTSNVSEYGALIAGLQYMIDQGISGPLHCKGDSQLIVNQVSGKWGGKKEHLLLLRDKAHALLERISNKRWQITWIPREQNTEADALSNSVENVPPFVFPVKVRGLTPAARTQSSDHFFDDASL